MESKKTKTKQLFVTFGTYEGNSFHITLNVKEKSIISKYSIQTSQHALRTIHLDYPFNFISGTDEVIHMFDMKEKTSLGDILTYSGSINDIKIYKDWLIAAGDEPTLPLWRMSDFTNIINMKGHKGSILSIDIHHKGGFLVSTGKDKNIIIFDMMTGRKITKFELDYICNKVLLFNKSTFLLGIADLHILVFDLMKSSENLDAFMKLDFNKKILDAFIFKEKLIVFMTDGEVRVFNMLFEENKFTGFNKDFVSINLEVPKKEEENDVEVKPKFVSIAKDEKIKILTVVFTNNEIYLYDFNKIIKREKVDLLKKYFKLNLYIKDKITCVASQFI